LGDIENRKDEHKDDPNYHDDYDYDVRDEFKYFLEKILEKAKPGTLFVFVDAWLQETVRNFNILSEWTNEMGKKGGYQLTVAQELTKNVLGSVAYHGDAYQRRSLDFLKIVKILEIEMVKNIPVNYVVLRKDKLPVTGKNDKPWLPPESPFKYLYE